MAEHSYIALDWITEEVEQSLSDARQALEDFVADRDDITKLRFCVNYAHQVHGSLKMVELHGAALLAAEIEAVADAMVNNEVEDQNDALEALMAGLLQLSAYLRLVNTTRQDQPAKLLATINELRYIADKEVLTEAAFFNPDLSASQKTEQTLRKPKIAVKDFNELIRKLRQVYQASMVGIIRDQNVAANYEKLNKVCEHLHKVSQGTASESLWRIAHAAMSALQHMPDSASSATKAVLKQVDHEIKQLQDIGRDALERPADANILRSLLYTIACADPCNELVRSVQADYRLKEALPELELGSKADVVLPDSAAIRAVLEAINEELNQIQDIFDLSTRGGDRSKVLSDAIPLLQRVINTLSVLGSSKPLQIIRTQFDRLRAIQTEERSPELAELVDISAHIVAVQEALARSKSFELGRSVNETQLDDAHEVVIREARNGLDSAKDAIIEFVASKWDPQTLQAVPALLAEIRGGLSMVPLAKAAQVIGSCERFVKEQLLKGGDVPEWTLLDTLADAISSVEYYLECLAGDARAELASILDVAEESVSQLGYPLSPTLTAVPDAVAENEQADTSDAELQVQAGDEEASGEEISEQALTEEPLADEVLIEDALLDDERHSEAVLSDDADSSTLNGAQAESVAEASGDAIEQHTADIDIAPPGEEDGSAVPSAAVEDSEDEDLDGEFDEEIVEIFVEEAAEVIEAIEEHLPALQANLDDSEALGEIRRAFHTLKGSGRMVNANDVGELAWAIESMLNRIIDGSQSVTPLRVELIREVTGIVPGMVEKFEARKKVNPALYAHFIATAQQLMDGQELAGILPAATVATPEPAESASIETVAEEIAGEQAATPDETLAEAVSIDDLVSEAEPADAESGEEASGLELSLEDEEPQPAVAEEESVSAETEEVLAGDDDQHIEFDIDDIDDLPAIGAANAQEEPVLEFVDDMVSLDEEHESVAEVTAELSDSGDEPLSSGEPEHIEIDQIDDKALIDIFAAEAAAHLLVMKDYISKASELDDDVELSEELQRALHTLKGSAHMAEIKPIADVVTPLEKLVKEIRLVQHKVGAEDLSLLNKGVELIEQGLQQLGSTPQRELDGAEDYISQLDDRYQVHAASETSEPVDALEKALAELLESGMESLLQSTDELATFSADHLPDQAWLQQRAGIFDSFALQALEAQQAEINQLAAALAALYQHATGFADRLNADVLSLLQRSHEVLIDMMDVMVAGEQNKPATDMIKELAAMKETLASLTVVVEQPEALSAEPAEERVDHPVSVDDVSRDLEGIDAETLEIFVEEASELIDALDESFHEWQGDRSDTGNVSEMMRTLHTMKGGARLVGMVALGNMAHNYESLLETSKTYDDAFFSLLKQNHEQLHAMIDQVMSHNAGQVKAEPAAEQEPELVPLEEVDEEIVSIFLEESSELLDGIDQALNAWTDNPGDLSKVEELKRLLHTFKGGSRLAGIKVLGDLSHEFETMLIEADEDGEFAADVFNKARQYHDQLHTIVDRIQGGESIAALNDLDTQAPNPESTQTTAGEIELVSNPDIELPDEIVPTGADIIPFNRDRSPAMKVNVTLAAEEATKAFISGFEQDQSKSRAPQEVVKVPAQLLQELVNLAGETSISRSRIEEQISEMSFAIEEMETTVDRLKGQLRRLDIETEAQILFRQEQVESEGLDSFDPLEMDRFSHLQQLSRSLVESASDLQEVKATFSTKMRDMETLLVQQQRINTELQEGLMRSQMVPFARMVPRLRRIVRQVSHELHKQVEFQFVDSEGELDRNVLERMVAPLEHMLRNAVDHGIESLDARREAGKPDYGTITLSMHREGGEIVLILQDDGGGVNLEAVRKKAIEQGIMEANASLSDHEILQFILTAGFSTATTVTQLSGRGVGMDVVHSEIKQLGGTMDIKSARGRGTEFIVRLPFTVSVNRALMVCIGNDTYAIPLNTIEGIVRVSPYELESYYQPDAPAFEYAGQSYELRYMGSLLDSQAKAKLEGQSMPLPVVLVRSSEHSVAVQVDRLLGSREIVVKTLGPQFSMVEGLSGATVLGDGGVVVILDLLSLLRAAVARQQAADLGGNREELHIAPQARNLQVMVVDDSVTVRKVTSRFLERHGIDVVLAKDGMDAVTQLAEADVLPDVMLLDIEMPRMDGFEVATRVRHSERLKDIPIIMITSRTGDKHRERALSLGVNNYLGKPYQEALLLEAISQLTGREIEIR